MKLEWKTCLKIVVTVAVIYLFIYYWDSISDVGALLIATLNQLLSGALIAYVINIVMSFYERLYFPRSNRKAVIKTRRTVCLVLSVLTIIGIVALIVVLIIPELIECSQVLAQKLTPYIERLPEFIGKSELLSALLEENLGITPDSLDWKSLLSKAVEFLISGASGVVESVVSVVSTVIGVVLAVFISAIFSLYLLMNRDRLIEGSHRLMNACIKPEKASVILHVIRVANDSFRRFIVGQCTEAVILGILCLVGMLIFRFPYATMISALIGFTALIPIAGAYIGAGVGAFMIMTDSPLKAILFIVFIVILQQLEGNFIYPKVVGDSVGLPGIWVFVAIIIGGGLFGILGMLLGVPALATLYRLLREYVSKRESAMERRNASETLQ